MTVEAWADIAGKPNDAVYVGFSTVPSNPISRIVRAVTGSDASHVWLVVSLFGVRCVVEAGDFGFFPSMTFDRFRKKNQVVDFFPIRHDLRAGLHWAANHFGEKYDYGGLIGMAPVMLGRFFHRRWRNPFGSRNALFCSEAISEIFKRSRVPGFQKFVPEETTPEQIRTVLRNAEFQRLSESVRQTRDKSKVLVASRAKEDRT